MNKFQLSDLSPEQIAALPDYQPEQPKSKKSAPPPFMHEASSYLMARDLHPGRTSSLRKISRGLRIAFGARGPIDKQVKALRPGVPIIRSKAPKVKVRFFGGSRRLSDRSKYILGALAILSVLYLHFRCRPKATVQYGEDVLIFTVRNAEITRVIRREGRVEVHIDRKVHLQEQRLAA